MSTRFTPYRDWSVGARITSITIALVGVILAALFAMISWTTSAMLEARAVESTHHDLRGVVNMIELFNKAVSSEAVSFGRLFASDFEGEFSVDAASVAPVGALEAPLLQNAGKPLNLDFAVAETASSSWKTARSSRPAPMQRWWRRAVSMPTWRRCSFTTCR